jgi:hypothetical protein
VDGLQVGEGGLGGDGLHLIGRAVQGGQAVQDGLSGVAPPGHAGARRAIWKTDGPLDLPGGLVQITAPAWGCPPALVTLARPSRSSAGGLHLVAVMRWKAGIRPGEEPPVRP